MRDGNELHMTPSIGYAVADEQSTGFDALLKNAGTAMYASKAGTLGTCVAFCESMRDEALGRVQLESALREALRDDRLEMHYQPKYAVDDGSVAGLEALLRWHDPARGWVSPLDIVSVAEETG